MDVNNHNNFDFKDNVFLFKFIQVNNNPSPQQDSNQQKKEKKPFWERVKTLFSGLGFIIDFLKKISPLLFFLFSSC